MECPKGIAVIGGGISGLVAGVELKRAGHEVTVFERSASAGGAISTVREGGWLCEEGPNTLQVSNPDVAAFLAREGLLESSVEASTQSKKRFILRGGKLHPVPMSPLEGLKTGLWSVMGRLRVLKEPFVRAAPVDQEESLATFVRRRLGQELLDYAIDPFVAGVYAGRAEDLSVRYATPKIYHLEQKFGSLIKGAIQLGRERKRSGRHFKTKLLSWPEGLATLPTHLANSLGESLRRSCKIDRIARLNNGGWEISSDHASKPEAFEHVILALPARALLGLPIEQAEVLEAFRAVNEVDYPPVSVLQVGFARTQVRHPLDGFGFLIPSKERRRILGCLFSSTLFEGRAPKDHVLLTVFLGGCRQSEEAHDQKEDLLDTALPELRSLLEIDGDPVFAHFRHWQQAIPQYTVGYGRILEAIEAAEARFPGIHLLGQLRDGISLSYCIEAGLKAPQRIL